MVGFGNNQGVGGGSSLEELYVSARPLKTSMKQ